MTKAQLNSGVTAKPITLDSVTVILAERIMGWTAAPDRFLMNGRRWIPRWRFQPLKRLEDAFGLLEKAEPEEYTTGTATSGGFWAKVRVAGNTGEARGSTLALAISFAVARAVGVKVDSPE